MTDSNTQFVTLRTLTKERTIPGHVDSTGKLFSRLALLTKSEMVYLEGKKTITVEPPRQVVLAPSLLREFRCIDGCTACCLPFTLDFLPSEFANFLEKWAPDVAEQAEQEFSRREVEVNGVKREIFSFKQYEYPTCPYLRPTRKGGALGCGFWTEFNTPTQPTECAAAPQISITTRGPRQTMVMKKPFGRAWQWRVTPQCEFDDRVESLRGLPDEYDLTNEINIFRRYLGWAQYFEVETWIPEVIEAMGHLPQLFKAQKSWAGVDVTKL